MKHEETLAKLNEYKDTHPNIISLWKHYIGIKRESYKNSIQECIKAIEHFETLEDVNSDILLLFYSLRLTANES